MSIGGKKIENITTVGQLRDALIKWHPDTQVRGTFDDEAIVLQEWNDHDTRELECLEISFEQIKE